MAAEREGRNGQSGVLPEVWEPSSQSFSKEWALPAGIRHALGTSGGRNAAGALPLWGKRNNAFSDDPKRAANMGRSGTGNAGRIRLGIELALDQSQTGRQIKGFIGVTDDQ